MALSTKKYFIYIIFLVSPSSLSLYAQSSAINKPIVYAGSQCKFTMLTMTDQNNGLTVIINSKLDNSNQFILRLSTTKDNPTIATEKNDQYSDCKENSFISSTSILTKCIIENYKYDFSKTFIDILFFERIGLVKTRTI